MAKVELEDVLMDVSTQGYTDIVQISFVFHAEKLTSEEFQMLVAATGRRQANVELDFDIIG